MSSTAIIKEKVDEIIKLTKEEIVKYEQKEIATKEEVSNNVAKIVKEVVDK